MTNRRTYSPPARQIVPIGNVSRVARHRSQLTDEAIGAGFVGRTPTGRNSTHEPLPC